MDTQVTEHFRRPATAAAWEAHREEQAVQGGDGRLSGRCPGRAVSGHSQEGGPGQAVTEAQRLGSCVQHRMSSGHMRPLGLKQEFHAGGGQSLSHWQAY